MDNYLDSRVLIVPTDNDKVYRDTLCMAYACAVLDLSMSDFESKVKEMVKKRSEKDGLIEMLLSDMEIRVKRLLRYND